MEWIRLLFEGENTSSTRGIEFGDLIDQTLTPGGVGWGWNREQARVYVILHLYKHELLLERWMQRECVVCAKILQQVKNMFSFLNMLYLY